MESLIFDRGQGGDDLPPFPRWMEPHFRRLDNIGTAIGIAILAIVLGVPAFLILT